MSLREQLEAAVIALMKESGLLEVETRVECLGRSGDGYGPIDAYWHFWKISRAAVVVDLPPAPVEPEEPECAIDDRHMDTFHAAIRMRSACENAIETAGLKLSP